MKILIAILLILDFYLVYRIIKKIDDFFEQYDKLSENDNIDKHIPKIN